jgi:hypothetical protein
LKVSGIAWPVYAFYTVLPRVPYPHPTSTVYPDNELFTRSDTLSAQSMARTRERNESLSTKRPRYPRTHTPDPGAPILTLTAIMMHGPRLLACTPPQLSPCRQNTTDAPRARHAQSVWTNHTHTQRRSTHIAVFVSIKVIGRKEVGATRWLGLYSMQWVDRYGLTQPPPTNHPPPSFWSRCCVVCVYTVRVCVRLSWGLSRDHFIVW